MQRVPCVALILENLEGEVLLLLRDDKPAISYPNHWTLVGGKVEDGETPIQAMLRELMEETGLVVEFSFWKRYDRPHPQLIVDQHIYLAQTTARRKDIRLGEGQDVRFFMPHDIKGLKIGFEFGPLLEEYFLTHRR